MSSSIAAFALHRAFRPMIKLRHFSFLASSLAAPRVLAPKTPSTKAVNVEDKIRRTDSDENLLRVLEGKIDEQAPLVSLEAGLPKDAPFEITVKPGNRQIKLELDQEFQGEKIEVSVYYKYGDAAEGKNTDDDRQPHISLLVTIDKAGPCLGFWCNLYAEDLEIVRAGMRKPKDSGKGFYYSGCIDLNEGLKKAFNEYLGVRGIKVSLYKFLQGYFVTMDDRKYIARYKNLKEFVQN